MASSPLSIRFDDVLLERVRRRAAQRGATPSGLVQRLVDEALRVQEHPGILFRDGASGRRAGLIAGPDVWEVIAALRASELPGDDALVAAAEEFDLPLARVRAALAYYGAYPDEINAEIDDNERAADEAHRSWLAQQQLLA